MIKLLILTCGTNANYHIAKLLKSKFANSFHIIGTDINPRWQISTSPYLDSFHQSPATSDKGYYPYILNVCQKEHVNYILPSFDDDQQLFYDGNPDLTAMGVHSLGINSQLKELYRSKENMNAFLLKNHLPVPRFYSFNEIKIGKDVFVKPIKGVGSVGARKMRGEDITQAIASCNVLEEVCQEPEITLECFVYKGTVYSVARQRIAQRNGVCVKAKVYDDKKLTFIAQQFADSLPLPHIFNLQFMRNSMGEYVITDVNLRTAAGMSMSYAAGWDEISALANIMLNHSDEDITKHIQPVKHEQYVMRAYTDIVTKKVEQRIAFDLDGTLLDSRERHKLVMNDVLAEFEINLNTDDLIDYKSNGHNNIEWLQYKGVEKSTANSVQKRWIELIENEKYLTEDKLYETVIPYLEQLSQNNELFLITARNNERGTRDQLQRLGILPFLSGVRIIKSDATVSQEKANFLKENRINTLIGDTEVDQEAALKAGCSFSAVLHGFRSKSYWSQFNVNFVSLK